MNDDPATKSIPPGGDESSPSPEPASFQLSPGDRVGNYVIREQIGEGGFAIVYAADQEKPVRRKVALKIIKLGMDTKQVIARFEAEKQALAMMDHPNVAKVFDGGTTEAGRPYFVMEYVAGVPITEHCDRQRLDIEERLKLFMQVCEAVQHAHQKGIIHRDIKPSNILVQVKDGQTSPKVIDFGMAKAISQKLTERTIYTEQGQLIGTPEYMSPEQAEMTAQDIDTRSDIYSLGVVLYELLTGALPFESAVLRRAGFAEIQRIIREVEPPKPSTRLSSLGDLTSETAAQRRSDRRSLLRTLRGDLDWIVMKMLEKNRGRRYANVSDIAAEIRRHLDNEPVQAGPPSQTYRVRKYIRRHRVGVSVALLVMATAVTGIATAWQSARAARAMAAVERMEEFNPYWREVMELAFLYANRLAADRPPLEGSSRELIRTHVDALAGRVQEHPPASRQIENFVRQVLAGIYIQIGEYDAGVALLLAYIADECGSVKHGIPLPFVCQEAVQGLWFALDTDLPATIAAMRSRVSQLQTEQLAELEFGYLQMRDQVLKTPDDHWHRGVGLVAWGEFLGRLRRFEEAESALLEGHDNLASTLGSDHGRTVGALAMIADFYDAWGKADRAAEWRAKLPAEQDAVASDPRADEKQDTGLSRD